MADFLDGLLPRFFPCLGFQCVPHDGKRYLGKSVPRKLHARRRGPEEVRFVVVRDQNSENCRDVKAKSPRLRQQAGCRDALVRIVCRELEAWYVGEPNALAIAFPGARGVERELGRARYRYPDTVVFTKAHDAASERRPPAVTWPLRRRRRIPNGAGLRYSRSPP